MVGNVEVWYARDSERVWDDANEPTGRDMAQLRVQLRAYRRDAHRRDASGGSRDGGSWPERVVGKRGQCDRTDLSACFPCTPGGSRRFLEPDAAESAGSAAYAQTAYCAWDGSNAFSGGALRNCACNTVQFGAIPAELRLPKPTTGRIAVKAVNHLGDEVMKVFPV